ncbi:acetylxylan esterase [Opitutales bacterium ASA1]|uniref:acetylxylan esterase n=1 Tax=Congregicoccus parvus TaxID=3081749 RepID=UPI002B2A8934|nr:acetylxylan esterase [Opitutales bacterium ASA1]
MPVLDLPLSELNNYAGRNPRPADFDAYWDAALAELAATDPAPELVPNPQLQTRIAECFDLWFTGVGGARIHARYLRPRVREGRVPAVLQFHGYSGNAGDWRGKLPFVAEGLCVAAMDCRGQGGSSEDTGGVKGTTLRGHIVRGLDDPDPRRILFRNIFLDTAQLARVVMGFDEVDPARVGAMGGSQGGALTLACAALVPEIKRAAPVFPFLCDYRRVWEMDLAKDAYEELRWFFRSFDPRHEREEEIFTKLGYIDCQHLAPRIRAEVLFFTGLMDPICPPSSQFAAYNKITAPKHMVLYPDFGHEHLPDSPDLEFNFMLGL